MLRQMQRALWRYGKTVVVWAWSMEFEYGSRSGGRPNAWLKLSRIHETLKFDTTEIMTSTPRI